MKKVMAKSGVKKAQNGMSTKTAKAKPMAKKAPAKMAMKKPAVKKAQEGMSTGSATTSGRGPNKGNFTRNKPGIATDTMPANNIFGMKYIRSEEEQQYNKDNGISNAPFPKKVTNSKYIKGGEFNKKEEKKTTGTQSEIINKSSSPKSKQKNGGKIKR